MAILDIHDLGLAREQGRDIVGVMAFVQRPLAAVLAQPAIRSPADLEGERAGVTGLPSDEAVLRSIVAGDGGDPERGAHDDDRLPGGQGAAGRARRGRDGVLERRGRRAARAAARASGSSASTTSARRATRSSCWRVTRATLEDDAPVVRATIRALQRGYGEAQRDPESAVAAMLAAEPRLDQAALAAQLDAVDEAFTAGARAFGQLRPRRAARRGRAGTSSSAILDEPLDVERAFDIVAASGPAPPR